MKNLTLMKLGFLSLMLLPLFSYAQQDDVYKYRVDLIEVISDQVKVTLEVPSSVPDKEVIYQFPRIVPGTYEIHDFGQFITQFKAFDSKGKELSVERIDKNQWKIKKAKKLAKISYWANDSWDAELPRPMFEPAGTSFDPGKVFVLNGSGLFGFFKGKELLPFEIEFDRPNNFYASTALRHQGGDYDTDRFKAANYHDLVDAPVMYAEADTTSFQLGYGTIQISVYSPRKKVNAKELAQKIRPLLEAQTKYLGNILPVNRYHFILYLSSTGYPTGRVSALEHAQSSFFCLAEESVNKISKIVMDFSSHEFFHIVTPLYIQSEEIYNFDYMDPQMSKHLWLYEGVVEYMAHHMQCRYELKSQDDFLAVMSSKIQQSIQHYDNSIPLTEMSSKILQEPYSREYNNIYERGAVTAMCLDMLLMRISEGKYDLQFLLRDLSGYYGRDTPFRDDELFTKIVDFTRFKELKPFFEKYLEGSEPIPYNEFTKPFGIEYFEEAMVKELSPLGGLENGVLGMDNQKRYTISKPERLDDFGKNYIGFKEGDVILTWNDQPMNPRTMSVIILVYMQNVKVGDPLEIKILRDGKEMTLKTKMTKIDVKKQHVFKFVENPTAAQLKLRRLWLEPRNK
jgi:predicted metalloprotease with PDZ domain